VKYHRGEKHVSREGAESIRRRGTIPPSNSSKLLTCDSGLAYCFTLIKMAVRPQDAGQPAPDLSPRNSNVAMIEGEQNVLRFPQTLSRSNPHFNYASRRHA
jgi:hypothetical protein